MSAETTTSSITPASGHVTIVFTSDWGVSTGVGQVGRTHSTIERGSNGHPVVRGTVITGVLREQAFIAARALDSAKGTPGASGSPDASGAPDIPKGPWESFAEWLFGQHPDLSPGQHPHPRHVVFTDASPVAHMPIHDTVSLSIDPGMGTARDQMLRFTERAAPGVLTGSFTLIDEAGAELSDQTIDAAHFLLGVAGLMVRGIGSGRSGGDGECTVAVTDTNYLQIDLKDTAATEALNRILTNHESDANSPTYTSADVKAVADRLRNLARDGLQAIPEPPQDLPKAAPHNYDIPDSDQSISGDTTWYEAALDIVLESPVVSYEVPFSNEVRSLDFLRGTVLVPWLHGLLRNKFKDCARVNSAIVSGDLRISDALPVYEDIVGLPVPFVLEDEKVPEEKENRPEDRQDIPLDKEDDGEPCTLFNRHIAIDKQECGKNTIPVRGCYVFLVLPQNGNGDLVKGWIGKPSLIGRQSTAISMETGAAKDGQLFIVRALPAGLRLRASVVVSADLLEVLSGTDTKSAPSSVPCNLSISREQAFLGSRKLTGTFGRAHCTVGNTFTRVGTTPPRAEGPATTEGSHASSYNFDDGVSLWFTSDVLARSSSLGPGGSVEDLKLAFARANVPVTIIEESPDDDTLHSRPDQDSDKRNRKQILTAIRHRRVDSWSPRDNAPRATRLAIQAGSVVQVRVSPDNLESLKALGRIGVGELTAQGYGRFIVDSPALRAAKLPLTKTKSKQFTTTTKASS